MRPAPLLPSAWNTLQRHAGVGLLLLLAAGPLLASLAHAAAAGLDAAAWAALWQDPVAPWAWGMTVWTGLASAALATAGCASLLAWASTPGLQQRLLRHQGWLLAVPHLAFAVGLVLLIAPSGWLLRALSPWATGLHAPPPWPTTQDPWGLGLMAVLALKETPFLLWAASTHLLRPDVAQRLQRELQLAASFGYGAEAAWWRIVWPQLLPRLAAPLLAVLAFSLTVVDVAQVIAPTRPPTLAVLCWQWLQDANPLDNAKGAAAAWALAATVALSAAAAWAVLHAPLWRRALTRGAPWHGGSDTRSASDTLAHAESDTAGLGRGHGPVRPSERVLRSLQPGRMAGAALLATYLLVLAALLLGSVMGSWPFPALLPTHWSLAAWGAVQASAGTVGTTLWLATASALCALLWVVAWLEWAPPRWQQRMQTLAYAPLLLPTLLWVIGLHRLGLASGLDGTATGVWLAHTLACLPYVLLTMAGAYGGFDARWWQLAASLGQSRRTFLLRVKWPLLRATLCAGFAVGFAVSVAQYLPTLYVGAGRLATVTTEAVALAAGGQRSLMAAFAWLQWLLPALVFALAAWLGRPRRLRPRAPTLGTIQP